MANVNEIAEKYGHKVRQNDASNNSDAFKMAESKRKDAENVAKQILKLISSYKIPKTANYGNVGDMGRVFEVVKNALGEINWLKK